MEPNAHRDDNDHGRDFVTISMSSDGTSKEFSIHRGHRTVAEIKVACNVSANWVIEQIDEHGQPVLLDDNAAVTIKGGERFLAHVRGGGSS